MKSFSMEDKDPLCYTVNIMATDARVSAAMNMMELT